MYIVGGKILTMAGREYDDGVIHVVDGKIKEIGAKGQISINPKDKEQSY